MSGAAALADPFRGRPTQQIGVGRAGEREDSRVIHGPLLRLVLATCGNMRTGRAFLAPDAPAPQCSHCGTDPVFEGGARL